MNFAKSLIDFYIAYIYNCTGNIEFLKKYENCEEICGYACDCREREKTTA